MIDVRHKQTVEETISQLYKHYKCLYLIYSVTFPKIKFNFLSDFPSLVIRRSKIQKFTLTLQLEILEFSQVRPVGSC